MKSLTFSFATPSRKRSEVLVYWMPGARSDESTAAAVASMIIDLKIRFGLELILVDEEAHCSYGSNTLDCGTVMECLVGAICHYILEEEKWFAFSVDGQTSGVFARTSSDGSSFLDVVVLKGFTNNSNGIIILFTNFIILNRS